MKKLLISSLAFGLLAITDVAAQSASTSYGSSAKDEYWGTSKTKTRSSDAEGVGKRSAGLNDRFNEYGNPARTTKMFSTSKKMKAIQKKEKEMFKKRKRDKRMLDKARRD
jgi:hypothetical protein